MQDSRTNSTPRDAGGLPQTPTLDRIPDLSWESGKIAQFLERAQRPARKSRDRE